MAKNNSYPCTTGYNYPQGMDGIIKLWVDECTGKLINPITVTDAVITNYGGNLTSALCDIYSRLDENGQSITSISEDILAISNRLETLESQTADFVTKDELCAFRDELENILTEIKDLLEVNLELFNLLLTYLMSANNSD